MRLSGLGVWNLYFLVKFVLYSRGDISFDLIANLAFFAFLAISFQHIWLSRFKHAVSVVVGAALLYYDSWLPPISRLTKQAGNVQDFSIDYFFEITARVISLDMVLALFTLVVFYWLTVKWLRYTSISIIGFVYAYWLGGVATGNEVMPQVATNSQTTKKQVPVLVSDTAKQKTPDQQLQDFYQQQNLLQSQIPEGNAPF